MVRLIWDNEQEFIDITDDLIKTLTACMEQTLAFETFDKDAEVSLTFTDNSGIKERNQIARGIDKPTDVLSFPMLDYEADGTLEICDEDLSEGAVVLGDILISMERAVSQSEEYGHSLKRELCFLTVHSMLHLLGYDHERSQKEEALMFEKQDEILNQLGITR
ncbi:rRNA maturation RNase YbeY [Congzhengia minquanensis]|uniref:rRNA maturation RNase YbeY n=1 Tax=Congzhengia minquanensis TaxID=2763657 RepID=UPI002016A4A5|nr:rRNA maturation RNase YbeY [Congzhengia minquanensis]